MLCFPFFGSNGSYNFNLDPLKPHTRYLRSALDKAMDDAALRVEMICALETTNAKNSKRGAKTKVRKRLQGWDEFEGFFAI